MIHRLSLVTIFVSLLAVGAAYAAAFLPGGAPGWAPWAMALGVTALMVATMALGAVRHGRLGKLWLPFGFVLVVLAGGFGAMLALPPADPADPTLWLGLPPRAAVMLYGVGLLPLFAVPVAYALTFDEMTLSEADLARVRAEAAAMSSRRSAAADPRSLVAERQATDHRGPTTDDAVRVEVTR